MEVVKRSTSPECCISNILSCSCIGDVIFFFFRIVCANFQFVQLYKEIYTVAEFYFLMLKGTFYHLSFITPCKLSLALVFLPS